MIQLEAEGLTIAQVRQGFVSLSPACKAFEVYLTTNRIKHDNNPVLNWAISNVVIEIDAAENIKPSKRKSANKIDPLAALITGFRTYMLETEGLHQMNDEPVMMVAI